MTTQPAHHRRLRATAAAAMLAVAVVTVVLAPAAAAIPIEGTGGGSPEMSGVETIEIVRTVTETVGVPYLAAMAIGLLAFAAAWLLASYVVGHRAHRSTAG